MRLPTLCLPVLILALAACGQEQAPATTATPAPAATPAAPPAEPAPAQATVVDETAEVPRFSAPAVDGPCTTWPPIAASGWWSTSGRPGVAPA